MLASIPIDNPSFEDPALADGASSNTIPGWTITTQDWYGDYIRVLDPGSGQFPSQVPDGQNVLHMAAEGPYAGTAMVSQVLDATLVAGAKYTMSVDGTDATTYGTLAYFELWAGDDTLTGALLSARTVSYTAPASGPLLGKPLKVVMKFDANPAWVFPDEWGHAAFDDVRLEATSTPHGGTPFAAPGIIEAENFDLGGEGVAYHDTGKGNWYSTFRRKDNADVDVANDPAGGWNVNRTGTGEWLNYTVNVPAAGTYELATRVSAPGSGGTFSWQLDGAALSGATNVSVPDTGSYDNYQWVRNTVTLPAGTHVLKLVMGQQGSWPEGQTGVGIFDAFSINDPSASLAAPTALSAGGPFRNRVDLSWQDNTKHETDYEIQISTDGGSTWSGVATIRGDTTRYADTGPAASTAYRYRVRAVNDTRVSSWSSVATFTTPAATATPYRVNFQVERTPPMAGWKMDAGDLFGDRGDGLSYGWNKNHGHQEAHRGINGDFKLDSLIHIRSGSTWEMALPNGTYDVTVSVGDAAYASTHTIDVEGQTYWSNAALAKNQFLQKTVAVAVTDGQLTLSNPGAANRATRINYVEIAPRNVTGESVVTITASDASASETGPDNGTFTVTRTGGEQTQALDVYFTLAGTALLDGDYTVTGATPPKRIR